MRNGLQAHKHNGDRRVLLEISIIFNDKKSTAWILQNSLNTHC